MLVSHRNMISIYDMSKDKAIVNEEQKEASSGWIQTVTFDEGNIRTILVKKRPRKARVSLILKELKKLGKYNYEEDKSNVVLTNF